MCSSVVQPLPLPGKDATAEGVLATADTGAHHYDFSCSDCHSQKRGTELTAGLIHFIAGYTKFYFQTSCLFWFTV